ncbi:MAG: UDP-N-acetylmuramoylalanine--D-glutamate ligase [Desulforhopalus sp.]|jgi:UDP-N-acetylmuramoylalanine--D-glutamate ligase
MENRELIYPGQKVCVMGLGVTGRSAVKYCLSKGAKVSVSDARSEEKFLRDEGVFAKENELEWEAGGHTYDFLAKNDLLLPSPGIDLRGSLFSSLAQSGIPVAGELAVVAGLIDVPIVAVTGTNGKTTVATLIGEVLEGAGKKAFVGGNIGTPLYEYCLCQDHYDVVVVEVSSFQLECSGNFSPDIAILLNITPDHLDRHGTIDRYISAKGRIFAGQKSDGLAIINGDDPLCEKIKVPKNVKIEQVSRSARCFLEISDAKFSIQSTGDNREDFIHSLNGLGGFAAYNYGAAFLALRRLGLPWSTIKRGFQEFNHLPHRLEFVAELNGISFVNDSKATNTGAVIGALDQMEKGVVLIAGGRGKGDDYTLLRKSVEDKVHDLVLIGEAAAEIEDSLRDLVPCIRVLNMEEAVAKAYSLARTGDRVLLSPACASFDMFTSYGNRGDIFKSAVRDLVAKEQNKRGN